MNRWLTVVLLVLLVLVAAMSLRNATLSTNPNAGPVVVAEGAGPVPPIPWKNGAVAPAPWHK